MQLDFSKTYNEIAQKCSESNALHINGQYFTYKDLNREVQKIATVLKDEGLFEANAVIAVAEEAHITSYAAILAVFLTGNTLMPFDKRSPVGRNLYMFEVAKPQLVITQEKDAVVESLIAGTPNHDCSWFTLSNASFVKKKAFYESFQLQATAYILFTSGSTGKPKGVPVSYKNLFHCLNYFFSNYQFCPSDRFLQVYQATFDVFYFSFLVPLCVGACCYFIDAGNQNIRYLQIFQEIKEHQITVVSMVPTVLLYIEKYLSGFNFPDLRHSFFSGDALHHSVAVKWKKCLPNGEIHNFYGPTETTIVCTRYPWNEDISAAESYHDIVPLGVPFDGMKYLVVDEENRPVEQQTIGELAFSGEQVINCYIDNEFSEKFFVDPSSQKRYYKTGDMAMVNNHGNLVFTGRKDFQYKINGYRVELAEVEAAITSIVKVPCQAVVVKDKIGLNTLYVFLLKNNMDEREVLSMLRKKLPNYMVPRMLLQVDAFPMNANQKVDRLMLQNLILNS